MDLLSLLNFCQVDGWAILSAYFNLLFPWLIGKFSIFSNVYWALVFPLQWIAWSYHLPIFLKLCSYLSSWNLFCWYLCLLETLTLCFMYCRYFSLVYDLSFDWAWVLESEGLGLGFLIWFHDFLATVCDLMILGFF